MSAWLEPFQSPGSLALGWALVHLLWQGALVLLVHAAAQRALVRRSPEARYAAAVVALGLLALAPAVTLVASAVFGSGAAGGSASGSPHAGGGPGESWLALAVAAWCAGVLVLSARLVGGWRMARRLARVDVGALPPELAERFAALAEHMRVRRAVRFLASRRVDVPLVVGWLRPAVLLPAGALLSLSPRELEAVVAHELAHVRRADYLVNLLQCAVEVLLFFHPAVWILSRRIREERELCCDDAAVGVVGEPATYARALVRLEDLRATPPFAAQPALAATDGPLLARVRRVLGARAAADAPRARCGVPAGLLALLLVGVVAGAPGCGSHQARLELDRAHAEKELAVHWLGQLREVLETGEHTTLIEKIDGSERRWETRPGPDGLPTHTYFVNGEERPIDAEAEAWHEAMLTREPPDRPEPGALEVEREVLRIREEEEEVNR